MGGEIQIFRRKNWRGDQWNERSYLIKRWWNKGTERKVLITKIPLWIKDSNSWTRYSVFWKADIKNKRGKKPLRKHGRKILHPWRQAKEDGKKITGKIIGLQDRKTRFKWDHSEIISWVSFA